MFASHDHLLAIAMYRFEMLGKWEILKWKLIQICIKWILKNNQEDRMLTFVASHIFFIRETEDGWAPTFDYKLNRGQSPELKSLCLRIFWWIDEAMTIDSLNEMNDISLIRTIIRLVECKLGTKTYFWRKKYTELSLFLSLSLYTRDQI